MRLCDSPNVVKIVERLESISKIYIVMEFCDGPDLESYLKGKKGRLSEEESLIILRQLACGFQELQKHNIIHRDLKPANIFSNSGEFKIGDLGFARVMEKQEDLTSTMLGSLCYMAPELLSGEPYSFSVDIWSLGVVFHEMLLGRRPFGGPNIGSFYAMLATIKSTPLNLKELSEPVRKLLSRMLTVDPDKRITWDEFYEDPLLAQDNLLISIDIPVVRRGTSRETIDKKGHGDKKQTDKKDII